MAYKLYLASVSREDIEACQFNKAHTTSPSMLEVCSYMLIDVNNKPIGDILKKAIDGGVELSNEFRHRKRNPQWHDADAVHSISADLVSHSKALSGMQQDEEGWFVSEIIKLAKLFSHASARDESVITALDLGDMPLWSKR